MKKMKKDGKKTNISRRNFFDKMTGKISAFAVGIGAGLFVKRSQSGVSAPVSARPISRAQQQNPYEYNIDDLKIIDPELITYEETGQINVDLQELRGLTIDTDDKLFVYIVRKNIIFLCKIR